MTHPLELRDPQDAPESAAPSAADVIRMGSLLEVNRVPDP